MGALRNYVRAQKNHAAPFAATSRIHWGMRTLARKSGGVSFYSAIFSGGSGIQLISSAGAVSTWVSGSPLNYPYGLAIDGSGNVFVANYSSSNILKITPAGSMSVFKAGFYAPQSIAVDSSGNVYISDYNLGIIYKITSGGTQTTYMSGYSGTMAVAIDKSDNVYVLDSANSSGYIYKNGSGTAWVTVGVALVNIICDDAGNVYAVSNVATNASKLYKITPAASVSIMATGLATRVWGLAADAAGNIYDSVISGTGTYLQKITPAGVKSNFSALTQPSGLVIVTGG